MTALENFIVRVIANAAAVSTQNGKAKYSAYFVDTSIYHGYRDTVDTALTEIGHAHTILQLNSR